MKSESLIREIGLAAAALMIVADSFGYVAVQVVCGVIGLSACVLVLRIRRENAA